MIKHQVALLFGAFFTPLLRVLRADFYLCFVCFVYPLDNTFPPFYYTILWRTFATSSEICSR